MGGAQLPCTLITERTRLVPHAGAGVKALGPLQQAVDVLKGLRREGAGGGGGGGKEGAGAQ